MFLTCEADISHFQWNCLTNFSILTKTQICFIFLSVFTPYTFEQSSDLWFWCIYLYFEPFKSLFKNDPLFGVHLFIKQRQNKLWVFLRRAVKGSAKKHYCNAMLDNRGLKNHTLRKFVSTGLHFVTIIRVNMNKFCTKCDKVNCLT